MASDALRQPWQPDELAGFRVGDVVHVQSLGRCEVVDLLPPSLLVVRTPAGGEAKVGWRAVKKQYESRETA